MEKFLLGLCIVALTSVCGWILAGKYRRRKSFFAQTFEFNERFLGEVSYAKRPLGEFIERYSYTGEFEAILRAFSESIQKDESGVFDALVECDFLKEEEKEFLSDYFQTLGRGDSASQKAYFSTAKGQLSEYKKQAFEEKKRYSELYLKLGFLFGLAVLVLIV